MLDAPRGGGYVGRCSLMMVCSLWFRVWGAVARGCRGRGEVRNTSQGRCPATFPFRVLYGDRTPDIVPSVTLTACQRVSESSWRGWSRSVCSDQALASRSRRGSFEAPRPPSHRFAFNSISDLPIAGKISLARSLGTPGVVARNLTTIGN